MNEQCMANADLEQTNESPEEKWSPRATFFFVAGTGGAFWSIMYLIWLASRAA